MDGKVSEGERFGMISDMTGKTLIKLEKLWYGDHFAVPSLPDDIFCIINVGEYRVDAIRRTEAFKLKEDGYGYIGSGVVEFKRTEDVFFIPVGIIGVDE